MVTRSYTSTQSHQEVVPIVVVGPGLVATVDLAAGHAATHLTVVTTGGRVQGVSPDLHSFCFYKCFDC